MQSGRLLTSSRPPTAGKGGGYIRREYAAGLGFVDMVAEFGGEKFVFEVKTERNFKREKALEQVTTYARKMSVAECYLMVFRKEMAAEELVGQREVVEYEGGLLLCQQDVLVLFEPFFLPEGERRSLTCSGKAEAEIDEVGIGLPVGAGDTSANFCSRCPHAACTTGVSSTRTRCGMCRFLRRY